MYSVKSNWDGDVQVYEVINSETKKVVITLSDDGDAGAVADMLNEGSLVETAK